MSLSEGAAAGSQDVMSMGSASIEIQCDELNMESVRRSPTSTELDIEGRKEKFKQQLPQFIRPLWLTYASNRKVAMLQRCVWVVLSVLIVLMMFISAHRGLLTESYTVSATGKPVPSESKGSKCSTADGTIPSVKLTFEHHSTMSQTQTVTGFVQCSLQLDPVPSSECPAAGVTDAEWHLVNHLREFRTERLRTVTLMWAPVGESLTGQPSYEEHKGYFVDDRLAILPYSASWKANITFWDPMELLYLNNTSVTCRHHYEANVWMYVCVTIAQLLGCVFAGVHLIRARPWRATLIDRSWNVYCGVLVLLAFVYVIFNSSRSLLSTAEDTNFTFVYCCFVIETIAYYSFHILLFSCPTLGASDEQIHAYHNKHASDSANSRASDEQTHGQSVRMRELYYGMSTEELQPVDHWEHAVKFAPLSPCLGNLTPPVFRNATQMLYSTSFVHSIHL